MEEEDSRGGADQGIEDNQSGEHYVEPEQRGQGTVLLDLIVIHLGEWTESKCILRIYFVSLLIFCFSFPLYLTGNDYTCPGYPSLGRVD